jgi:hypothetical protein
MTSPAARRLPRRAYTMLEVILALAIGLVMFAGLYTALGIFQRGSTSGRNLLDQNNVARSVIDQLNTDVAAHLGTTDPNLTVQPTSTSSSMSGTSGTTGSTSSSKTTGTTGTSGTKTTSTTTTNGKVTGTTTTGDGDADDKTTTSTSKTSSTASNTGSSKTGSTNSSSTSSSSSSSGSTTSVLGPFNFNLGVQGDDTHLVLYVSRVPRELQLGTTGTNGMGGNTAAGSNSTDPSAPIVSDLRRVTYWLAGGTGASMGLARQEVKVPTSDDQINTLPPNVGNEGSFVIAPQVKTLTFEYFDGTTWQTSWDGTQVGSNGQTPIGPPLAIRITLTIAGPTTGTGATGQDRTYQHVVAIPTANNPNPPMTSSSSSSGSSSPSSSSTGGS